MEEFITYHGTNAECVSSIKKENFLPSTSQVEWLGTGVYFFIEGAFDPIICAREWAISSAWNKQENKLSYENYSILKTKVRGDRVVDLRIDTDLCVFEEMRQYILKRYESDLAGKAFRGLSSQDNFLCNAVSKSMKLDILIHNLYIKTKRQRIKRIDSRIPNSTVLCAKETAQILVEDIEEVENGEIT